MNKKEVSPEPIGDAVRKAGGADKVVVGKEPAEHVSVAEVAECFAGRAQFDGRGSAASPPRVRPAPVGLFPVSDIIKAFKMKNQDD